MTLNFYAEVRNKTKRGTSKQNNGQAHSTLAYPGTIYSSDSHYLVLSAETMHLFVE